MRITIVHAHPVRTSFSHAILDTVCDALRKHDLDVLDLYADDFHPALTDAEHRDYLTQDSSPDTLVGRYADSVRRAEALVFVYPTWWAGVPAILKGWLDRVLVKGVAFGFDDKGRVQPMLQHVERIGSVTTYGSPRVAVALTADGGKRTLHRALRVSTGLHTKSTRLGLYNMDTATQQKRAAFLETVRNKFEQW